MELLLVLLIWAFAEGLGWIITCGIIKLICICFGLVFKWKIATGIWLLLSLLSAFFKTAVNKK